VLICRSCGKENPSGFQFCGFCAAPLTAAVGLGEQRKTVTVLFCDVVGSTALGEMADPERLRAVLARYFERMKAIVERHGGSVEKFIGDAVMAVFGVPLLHEDDALRAVRAAAEMQDELPELGLEGRVGVMTGEVVTGTAERLATGDAVNVAARLEQAAQPGEVLIGEPTLELLADAVDVERLEPLQLKGKAEPVPAYRLLRVREARERRHGAPFVGRRRELEIAREAWERAGVERRCVLVTLVGDAGVGKSRLAAELVASLDATLVRGRCLPYGEGITYWPVIEVLKQLQLLPNHESASAAIRTLLGETEAATSAEEIAWAFRKTLEQAAAERPLVVVFDDVQWAEETFLDLIDHVALLSTGAAILLVCIARPELRERRPAWPMTLHLEPLADDEVAQLISEQVPESLRAKITRAAGGNPLFINEMLAIAQEAGDEVAVPPTLHALLAARLDQLETAERSVLERGAIEGEIFHRGAVQALAPAEMPVTRRLAGLVRKELIRPDKAQIQGEDGFRFRHLLIRDAAYDGLPKATRAELHSRFAAWLEQHGSDLVELDEILGYHLEQACRYRRELALPDDGLAATGRQRLAAAGRHALLREDFSAAVKLLERAAALTRGDELDVGLEVDLVHALFFGGRIAEAHQRAEAAAERAAATRDRRAELSFLIEAGTTKLHSDPEGAADTLEALAASALPGFEAAADDLGLCIAYTGLGWVAHMRAKDDTGLAAFERALFHARRLGLPHREYDLLAWVGSTRFHGTTPVSDLLAWFEDQAKRGVANIFNRSFWATALAMAGRIEEGRAAMAAAREELAERGTKLALAELTGLSSVDVELLAGDPAAAVEFGTEGCRLFEELGERSWLSTAAAELAQALYALDRLDEAEKWAGRAVELGASDDAATQMLSRQVRAKLLARRGEHAEAERVARDAVAIGEETEMLDRQGDSYADLAEVLTLANRPKEAAEALEQAVKRYERKGNVVSERRARARLAALHDAVSR
jgi:class 3 adenylate cyclase/tetratricopeptide (TPR) repeat protein